MVVLKKKRVWFWQGLSSQEETVQRIMFQGNLSVGLPLITCHLELLHPETILIYPDHNIIINFIHFSHTAN